ncbi:M48 family metallopeptidase [Candidatus Margulisiibacteriota bacterium]
MNLFLLLILIFYIGSYLLQVVTDILNLRHLLFQIPPEFYHFYDQTKYNRSQAYLKDNTVFSLIKDTIFTLIGISFILLGGFNALDILVRSFGFGYLVSGLFFVGILLLFLQFFGLPFEIYRTFVIEKKYGFNKTTVKTFIIDRIKLVVLGGIIGSFLLAGVLLFFNKLGANAWFVVWLFVFIVQLILYIIAPIWIMPLFNKFENLEDGELRQAVATYIKSQKYKIKGIYKMDGSKRSTKTNAFFTGFGRFRRIVLFDTLISKHSIPELIAVIGHEVGHYKKAHIYKLMVLSMLSLGLMLFIFSWFINNPYLFAAFKMENFSIYASLVFFGFLFTPIELLISFFSKVLSRKYEFEADYFAAATTKDPENMILALKKLSVENLSNLTPHPVKVFLEYSHPPVLERIEALRAIPFTTII